MMYIEHLDHYVLPLCWSRDIKHDDARLMSQTRIVQSLLYGSLLS